MYASNIVQDALQREYPYIFEKRRYPGIPEINLHDMEGGKEFFVGDVKILPIEVMHLKLPVLAFRVEDFTYITDANWISDESKEKIKGSKVLVVNALRKEKHVSHFNLEEAIELVKELEIPQAYFTHLSHQMGLHEEVESELPEGIHLAYDGLSFEL